MIGICSYSGYIPHYRLNRGLIFGAMGWMNPATIANARGEKAVANFDEDSITLAVSAGNTALKDVDRSTVEGLYFASTTLPYKERLNAGIMVPALGLKDQVRAADFTASLKSGTTALLVALDGIKENDPKKILVTAADCRLGKPGSPQEMLFGDAAAAVVVGSENVVAEYKGSYSVTYDFGDHFRGATSKFDNQWEDRWIRDLGMDQFIPEVITGLLAKTGLKISDFSKVIYPCIYPAARRGIAKKIGITPEMDLDNLQMEVGESGTPHALVMLAKALEEAKPGDKLMVVSFGSGCDALCFEVTDQINQLGHRTTFSKTLANKAALDNYNKLLVWRDIMPADFGKRKEVDHWTRYSAMWRNRKLVLGLVGGKCSKCGTAQIPAQDICVNPDCGAVNTLEPYPYADRTGKIASFTGDNLAASVDPPAVYGQVDFEGGGKFMFDFTDCKLDEVATDMKVTMSFRRKYFDEKRDISGYFWKAVPVKEDN
ncbi:MAG: OB-fold domain-containing protein [bacterium]